MLMETGCIYSLRFSFPSEQTQRLARYFSCCPFHVSLSEGSAPRSCSDALGEMRFGSPGFTAGARRSPAAQPPWAAAP